MSLAGWMPRPRPEPVRLTGRYVDVLPLSSAHFAELHAATCGPDDEGRWTWLPEAMPTGLPAFWMLWAGRLEADPTTYAIVPHGGKPQGTFALTSVDEANGVAELGWVLFGRDLVRTRAATEAVHLVQDHVLGELGYRRLEWKCDSLNEPSRRAAARFGFTHEGTFRHHRVVKGRNRDSAWFSITDAEWPAIRARNQAWLAPENFDAAGRQLTPLG